MDFREAIREDIDQVFLDPEEFGEAHTLNGKDGVYILIDDFELHNREKFRKEVKDDGTSLKRGMIYVKASDFGRLPSIGNQITIDRNHFRVEEAVNEFGVYAITVKAVR